MNILVTGSNGFIGKNLVAELRNRNDMHIMEYDKDTEPEQLEQYTRECEFVFHLAGVNRPENQDEFMEGNFELTGYLLKTLKKHGNTCPVLFASSIQAGQENPYGRSKRAGETLIFSHGEDTGSRVLVYRLPNVFGKWCRPNYNSAIATFCHNTARNLPIRIGEGEICCAYIDDVVEELIKALWSRETREDDFCIIPGVYTRTIREIAELIQSFAGSRASLGLPHMGDGFEKKLYSTYLSYLPENQMKYPLQMNTDERGSFTEIFRTPDRGQFSVNISKPGITKGNHWHHTKVEKFLVVSGEGMVRLRKIGQEEITEFHVSGNQLEVIDIPPGFTHNLINLGDSDLVTFIWANEGYCPEKPDTYFLKV